MATHTNLSSLFTDIADAIREKTGKTEAIVADNFPAEIAVIETGGGDPVLVWTNASPTSSFKSQTISFGSEGNAYLIEFRADTSNANYEIGYFVVGASNVYSTIFVSTSSVRFRRMTSIGSNSIVFGLGYSQGGASGNNNGIPTRIWSVKFTL